MKITNTLLVLVALGCASHIEAFSIGSGIGDLLHSATDNAKKVGDTLLGNSEKSAEQTDQKSNSNPLQIVSNTIQKATDTLQSGLNKAKEQTEQVTGNLQDVTKKVEDNVKETVENIQQNVDKQVNELTKKAESEGVDVSECKKVVKTIREAATTTLKNTGSCISQTVGKAKDAFTKAFTSAIKSLKELLSLKKQSDECSKNSQGILGGVKSATCLTTVQTKSAFFTATSAPSTIKNLVSATKNIVTLPFTLSSCASKTAGDLKEQSRKVIDNVKQCIAEKTGKKTEKKQESTEEKKENKESVARNPLNWLKSKIL